MAELVSTSHGDEQGQNLACFFGRLRNPPVEVDTKGTEMPPLLEDTVIKFQSLSVAIDLEMKPFWDGYRAPLAMLGIRLNELRQNVWVLPTTTMPLCLPYANRCTHEQPPLDAICLAPSFTAGRDALQQDVVLKMVDRGTMEDHIYRFLAECKDLYNPLVFPFVLPPIAIIDSPYNFDLVAMPMWGSKYNLSELETVSEVLRFMHCTLTALAFLHEKRIVHRDIHETNIMIDWYCYTADPSVHSQGLHAHRRNSSVSYALHDFDLALQMPPETSLKDCRRPSIEAWIGKCLYHPTDAWQGEVDYNPFAFDVGCLGNLFIYHFAESITKAPLLALLFAKMTTPVIEERFSAADALAHQYWLAGIFALMLLKAAVSHLHVFEYRRNHQKCPREPNTRAHIMASCRICARNWTNESQRPSDGVPVSPLTSTIAPSSAGHIPARLHYVLRTEALPTPAATALHLKALVVMGAEMFRRKSRIHGSDTKWLLLTVDVNREFPKGTPVVITGYQALPVSPTPYPGQDVGQQRLTMANTIYRFKKLQVNKTRSYLRSDEQSREITPNKLALVRNGRPNPSASFAPRQLVYVVDRVPSVSSSQFGRVPIKEGIRAMVAGPTSKGGPTSVLQSSRRHTTGQPWVLWYAMETVTQDWVHCAGTASSTMLRDATGTPELAHFLNHLATHPAGFTLVDMVGQDNPDALRGGT
ncbi:hypothetical protein BN946_scf184855.g13 [Trametes cinnabarina]|uniref:Protein kinase domain-containing protein n=1 Tax=Pycnoporus cinnabarinus TaxID=5643 RepID=A0A060SLZ5_PYCCI|nr:hypothetical protein BN946_scf184855.g13 [Trametes cinnabarina]